MPLTFDEPFYNFTIMESDKVTEIVGVVSVQPSNIPLWFDIVGKLGASGVRRTIQKQSIWMCGSESKKTNYKLSPPNWTHFCNAEMKMLF